MIAPFSLPASHPASKSQDSSIFDALNDRVANGERIDRDEARLLYERAPLHILGRIAESARYRENPTRTVTFLVDRNINYTNVCNTDCSFCAFYRPTSAHLESYVLSKAELTSKITEALNLGATRILLQGGHNDDLPYAYYLDLISWISQNFAIDINSFSPSEIQQISKVAGKGFREVLIDLKACGMHGLPGGGAEILDDEIRRRISPKKISSDTWIEIMGIAQELDLTTTATMVIGFGETIDHRLNHLERLRAQQDRARAAGHEGFNCFISWTHQFNENTSTGRSRHAERYGAGTIEYLRTLAISRIYLDNIVHHQSSWPTCGPEVAEVGLYYGCDDIGSTMMEENVVSKAGAPTKSRWFMSPNELMKHIRSAGFTPAQRDSSFAVVRRFEEASDVWEAGRTEAAAEPVYQIAR